MYSDTVEAERPLPLLCFYIGYTPDFVAPDPAASPPYGAELATVRLAEQLTGYFDVFVFGMGLSDADRRAVHYRHAAALHDFQRDHVIDVMVVSRYAHYFLEYTNRAQKTFFWMHDLLPLPYWDFKELPRHAKHLIENQMASIDGLIALSPWHREYVLEHYDVDPEKVFVVGNAIDTSLFEPDPRIARQPNRFIYTSAPNRGLDTLLECFVEIRREIDDAVLYIFRGHEDFTTELLDDIEALDHVHYMGGIDNVALAAEFMKSDVWFYPTGWEETYCISALEAQMAGCLCVASDLAALRTTVGDRGILLPGQPATGDVKNDAVRAVVDVLGDPQRKAEFQRRGQEWARNQTWAVRAKEWLSLIESTKR